MQDQTAVHSLWVEKYRPKTLKDYVGNEHVKQSFQWYVENQDIPHLLLHSRKPGSGKTTAAKMLSKLIVCDYMYINASHENSIDIVRNKIVHFASTMSFNPLKIIILDESDFLTGNAQAGLRNVMEQFSKSCRFVLTCNYIERIIEPVVSRCQTFEIIPPKKSDVGKRLAHILQQENIHFDLKDVATIVNLSYPDIRKAISLCQNGSRTGTLDVPKKIATQHSYIDSVMEVLQTHITPVQAVTQIRKILATANVSRFEELYTALYQNIDSWCTPEKIGECLLVIANYQQMDALVVDKEINTAAMFVALFNIIK